MLIVQKYGGTSLADPGRIMTAARRAAEENRKGHRVVVVVSAQGDTTDLLTETANAVQPHVPQREMDALLAVGEQMSAALMAIQLAALGHRAVSLTGWQAGLRTDGVYGNAQVLGLGNDRIQRELDDGKIVVVAGFQGINGAGDITTLGRGGSDTTAVALAAFLQARDCRIYTDVDGVYDKDPRVFSDAVKWDTVSYEVMLRLARQGAQVLHDKCVELAMLYAVPIRVLSSFRKGSGTVVTDCEEECCQKDENLFPQ